MSDGRLLLFNLRMDLDDPVLAFVNDWALGLARRFAAVDVLTMSAGRHETAANMRVYSVGKERGYSEGRRAAVFYTRLLRLLATQRYAACFAHMMPLFAAMGGPLLALRGVPLTLWYTHRQSSRTLRLATRFSRRVVTAAPDSFPLETDKLRPLGHGIDTDFYSPVPGPGPQGRPQIVQVARLMPIKHQATLLQAAAGLDADVVLVGDVPEGQDRAYHDHLQALAAAPELAGRVTLTGGLPAPAVREAYRSATLAVNLSPPGLFDKAVLEAMACGLPTVVSSPAFAPLLGPDRELLLIEGPQDAEGLAQRLKHLLALPPQTRAEIGARLRAGVVAGHGREALLDRLAAVLRRGEPGQ